MPPIEGDDGSEATPSEVFSQLGISGARCFSYCVALLCSASFIYCECYLVDPFSFANFKVFAATKTTSNC